MKKNYVNAIFKGKLLFGIESWGGTNKANIKLIEKEMFTAAKYALGKEDRYKSDRFRLRKLGWLELEKEIKFSEMKITHKILNQNILEEMSIIMPMNTNNNRIQNHRKLGTKPRYLMKSKLTRSTFRNCAYHYNTLPSMITKTLDLSKFKKLLKYHIITL